MILGWSTRSTGGKPACVLHLGEIEINKIQKIHLEDFFFSLEIFNVLNQSWSHGETCRKISVNSTKETFSQRMRKYYLL